MFCCVKIVISIFLKKTKTAPKFPVGDQSTSKMWRSELAKVYLKEKARDEFFMNFKKSNIMCIKIKPFKEMYSRERDMYIAQDLMGQTQ